MNAVKSISKPRGLENRVNVASSTNVTEGRGPPPGVAPTRIKERRSSQAYSSNTSQRRKEVLILASRAKRCRKESIGKFNLPPVLFSPHSSEAVQRAIARREVARF